MLITVWYVCMYVFPSVSCSGLIQHDPLHVGELGKCCSYHYHQSSDCNMSCSVRLLERNFRKSSAHFVLHREHVEPTLREPAREAFANLPRTLYHIGMPRDGSHVRTLIEVDRCRLSLWLHMFACLPRLRS